MENLTNYIIICIIFFLLMVIIMASNKESYKTLNPRNFPYGGPQVYDIQNMYYTGPNPSYVDSNCNYFY